MNAFFSRAVSRCTLFIVALGVGNVSTAQETTQLTLLKNMSLESLASVEVTIASKTPQKVSSTPAAVYVITGNDIDRSGARTIPDLLRMVPGLHVAQLDGNKWAVTSRGYGTNGRFSNKLLVLVDGRSVYTPLFSGVYWELLDLMLENVDRIEVIRGPGAAVWGANAVNGVINIITKDASQVEKTLVTTSVGTEEDYRVNARQRFSSDIGNVYIFGQTRERDAGVFTDGSPATDSNDSYRAGFRADLKPRARHQIMLQSEIAAQNNSERVTLPNVVTLGDTFDDKIDTSTSHFLASWSYSPINGATNRLQLYYDHSERKQSYIAGEVITYDADFQQSYLQQGGHQFTWGAGYRHWDGTSNNSSIAQFETESLSADVYSLFLQDAITLSDDVSLTLGSKFEKHNYTSLESQPSARLMWHVNEHNSVWFSASKAVRLPSRIQYQNGQLDSQTIAPSPATGNLPGLVRLLSGGSYTSEKVYAYESGYRFFADDFSLDIATFYNVHKHDRSIEPLPPSVNNDPVPHLVLPASIGTNVSAKTYGVEVVVDWLVKDWWKIVTAYSYIDIKIDLENASTDVLSRSAESGSPQHQVSLRSSFDLSNRVTLDFWTRYVDDVPALAIEDYVELDARASWQQTRNFSISFTGRNLLDNSHQEYASSIFITTPTEVEREFFLQAQLKYL